MPAQRVRTQLQLVAQREALLRLQAQDGAYTPLLQCWGRHLQQAERKALQAYDSLLIHYIKTAPRPEQPKQAVH